MRVGTDCKSRTACFVYAILVAGVLLPVGSLADEVSAGTKELAVSPMSPAQWRNVGYKTPEGAVQTYLWAVREGDLNAVLSVIPASQRPKTEQERQSFNEGAVAAQKAMLKIQSYQPLSLKQIDEETVEFRYRIQGAEPLKGGERMTVMKRIEGEWKIIE